VVNVQDGAQAVERTGRKQDVSQDSRISTTWISGTPSLFWKRVLTAKYVGDADFVWLFDSELTVHPSVNPLTQLVEVAKSTDAPIVFARPRIDRTMDAGCIATTVRVAHLFPSIVMKAEAWKLFHHGVLSQAPDTHLPHLEGGLGMLICGLVERSMRGNSDKAACVESHMASIQLVDQLLNRGATDCPAESCADPLRAMYPTAFNATARDFHDRCWAPGLRGMRQTNARRRPSKVSGSAVRSRAGR
jgi:hypothetical protein